MYTNTTLCRKRCGLKLDKTLQTVGCAIAFIGPNFMKIRQLLK